MKIKILNILALISLMLTACSEKPGSTTLNETEISTNLDENQEAIDNNMVKSIQTELIYMNQAPSLTLILLPKNDLQQSIATLTEAGGKLVYDPNNGHGGSIPFYIAELTPELINNTDFMKSLDLKAAAIDNPAKAAKPITTKATLTNLDSTHYIPTDSVKLSGLGDTKSLGEGVTVAVIDTGIDASHPAFSNRVVYWYDATQETRTELKPVTISNQSISIDLEGEIKNIVLPKEITEGKDVYAAIMQEKKLIAQLDEETKNKIGHLDINSNKSADNFLVVVTKDKTSTKIYFDVTGDLKLTTPNETKFRIDYNKTTKENRSLGMITFPTRNNISKYPLLLEEEKEKMFINLGKVDGMHGSHVAGIIAADDQKNNLLGAAPKADLMSLRVCSGISCTDSAIIKALYKAFYNGKVVPDVVNISLGSHESYRKSIYSHIIQDLSAKFGAIFFISASNSGPGFRSLNHFGNSGAAVMVGANVSDKILNAQYNLPSSAQTAKENLLFFSSLGPSYTGEMKPNIIAPGAAISAVEASGNYMSQANGTSMSSPLAAGAFASILAKSKADGVDYSKVQEMRAYHLARSTKAETSLLPYVYAMRDALQNSATKLPDLSVAQQGYGLLNAPKAKSFLDQYIREINEQKRDYFEVIVNNNRKGYDRSSKLKDINIYHLSLGIDGERTKESLARAIAKGLDVSLRKVEVVTTNGKVSILTGDGALKYFSIMDQGDSTAKLLNTHIALNNRRNTSFYSKRNLENMVKGNTYIAHYVVKSNNTTVTNLLDVAHKTFDLKEEKVSVPSIDPTLEKIKSGFSKNNVGIKTNAFHRYPFFVDGATNTLHIQLGINSNSQGRLFLQLYNPDGKEVEFVVAEKSPITGHSNASLKVSTITKGKVNSGIWELTISSSSSTWLSSSKYDLLVEGKSFGAKINKTEVKKGETKIIPIQLGGKSISQIIKKDINQFIVEKVKTKSSHFSIHPLNLPEEYVGEVQVRVDDKDNKWWGNIAPFLMIKENGKYIKYDGAKSIGRGSFKIKAPHNKLYFALDTITNYSNSKLTNSTDILVEVIFDAQEELELNVEKEDISAIDMALLKLTTPKSDSNAQFKINLSIFTGKVEMFTDLNGNVVLQMGKDSIENTIQISIKN